MKNLVEITPYKSMCFKHYPEPCCPAIFKDDNGQVFIVGKKINKNLYPQLKNKVGKDEEVVVIPKELMDVKV